MCNTEIGYFCSEHKNWRELLTQEPYCLKIKEDNEYIIFNYDQIRSDFNIPLVQEARGIIFNTGEWKNPVCWAFNKFGNYGESWVSDIDWSTAFVTEKIDGSLIKIWWDDFWRISTNGTIDAYKAEINNIKVSNFGDYFLKALNRYYTWEEFTQRLDKNLTYMFELVGPYNRIVIPYEEADLYFLGARNKYTGELFNCMPLVTGALGLGKFKLPKQYPLTSLEACIRVTKEFDWDQEGFVAADAEGKRVKIKSPAYVLAHYARNNNMITKKYLIRVVLLNEVEEFLCYASDYKEELLKVKNLITTFYRVGNKMVEICRKARSLSRSDYAELVKTFPDIYQPLLFFNYQSEEPFTTERLTRNWNENKWERYLEDFEKFICNYFYTEEV